MCLLQDHAISFMLVYLQYFKLDLRTEKLYYLLFFFFGSGSSLEAVTTCELCKEKLQLNLEDFDIHELHRAHANEQVSIFCLVW